MRIKVIQNPKINNVITPTVVYTGPLLTPLNITFLELDETAFTPLNIVYQQN